MASGVPETAEDEVAQAEGTASDESSTVRAGLAEGAAVVEESMAEEVVPEPTGAEELADRESIAPEYGFQEPEASAAGSSQEGSSLIEEETLALQAGEEPEEPMTASVGHETAAEVRPEETTPEADPGPSQDQEAEPQPVAEFERLTVDQSHQPAANNVEPVSVAAPPGGTEAVPNESTDDEATQRSHESETKPEVTT
jgi:hypothetical protein